MAIINDKYNLVYSDDFNIKDKEELEVSLSLTESKNDSSAIIGTVTDELGNPIPNATVKLFDFEGTPYLHVLTNAEGKYVFEDLAAGTYTVTAVNDKCIITPPKTVVLNENEIKTVDFVLEEDTSLKLGTVAGLTKEIIEDAMTISLANAKVYLKIAEEDITYATTLSADDGEFVFYEVENGNYVLYATKDGYRISTEILITVSNGSIINSTLLLVKDPETNTGTVSGFVKHNNIAIPGCYVGLYTVAESGEPEKLVATTRTNAIGYYMFGNVREGNYVVKSKQNKA